MLDIKIIRDKPELVKNNIKNRNLNLNLDEFLKIDSEKLDLIVKVDELRAIKNKVSKEIPTLSNEDKPFKIKEMKELGEKLLHLESIQKEVEKKWKYLYYKIPNILDDTAAIGNTDEDNVVEDTFLGKTDFDFDLKTHYEIGEKKLWIDIEKGSEVSGSRFWYIKGDLALLQFAILNFVISRLISKGFELIVPPVLVKEKAMWGTGFLVDQTDGLYKVNPEDDDLHLVGTSEVPVTSYHCGETLDLEKPKMYLSYSSCFRKEAGAAGKDTRGIFRGHQFDKLEMVCFCKPTESQKMHDFMISIEEEIRQEMKIPYKKMNVCSGDLGNPAMKKYDLEAWIPSQKKYREVTSCSNMGEYQSRRLSIKYKDNDNKLQYVHTLNGTVVALSRCLIAIIENYQTQNGDVVIPDVLKPFMGGKNII